MKQEFIAIPKPKMLEAIGLVTVKWAILDQILNQSLFWASDPDDIDTVKLLSQGSTVKRWAKLKDLLRMDFAREAGSEGMILLIDEALSIKGERDKIVHWPYSDGSSSETAAIFSIRNFDHAWYVDRPRVMQTAQKIDRLLARIFNHMLDHGERSGEGESMFVRPTGWRNAKRVAQDKVADAQ
ncbi:MULTISPECIES: hypothetical protein [Mesorhizobium]|nr:MULTISPECIES: hypothetical protein [Mesorhizobium]